MKFLKAQFVEKNTDENRTIVVHETSATDTTQVQKVINAVIESVMEKNMGQTRF